MCMQKVKYHENYVYNSLSTPTYMHMSTKGDIFKNHYLKIVEKTIVKNDF